MNNPYPYRPRAPLSREACEVLSIRFSPDWTMIEVAQAVRAMGGRMVADTRGGYVVVRDPDGTDRFASRVLEELFP
jgi:hypothetical protein